jgi:hypothetical protein
VSSLHPIEGRISAPPFRNTETGRISGSVEHHERGRVHGSPPPSGALEPGLSETPEAAVIAELGGLISALGSLSAQAQSLPLNAPTPPSVPQGGYKPQKTDYAQFVDNSN